MTWKFQLSLWNTVWRNLVGISQFIHFCACFLGHCATSGRTVLSFPPTLRILIIKDPSNSDSYRPIALAPNLSKALERCILNKYRSCLVTQIQEFSLDLHVYVLGCSIWISAWQFRCYSKAFDRVNHTVRCSWIGTFLAQCCAFCFHGTKIKNLLFVGIL